MTAASPSSALMLLLVLLLLLQCSRVIIAWGQHPLAVMVRDEHKTKRRRKALFLLQEQHSSHRRHSRSTSGSAVFQRPTQQQQQQQQSCPNTASSASDYRSTTTIAVQGIECVPVTIQLSGAVNVTIVEATAQSQERLVDRALQQDDKNITNSNNNKDCDIYGAVLWPAASVMAERLVSLIQSSPVLQKHRILEVGAGTGLVSLAACRGGASQVLATDYQELPLQLLEYAAQHLNKHVSRTSNESCWPLQTAHLDLCDLQKPLPRPTSSTTTNSTSIDDADTDFTLLVAADVLYEPATGVALAHRAVEALERGMSVWIGDSPGRADRPAFERTLKALLVLGDDDAPQFETVVGSTVTGERHELICGRNSTSVSATPQELHVAVLELDPKRHLPKTKRAA